MVFGLFKRKDPICGMKEEKGKGIEKDGKWFCNQNCLKQYEGAIKKTEKKMGKGGCCCH
jgi:YHS domain-containing protein